MINQRQSLKKQKIKLVVIFQSIITFIEALSLLIQMNPGINQGMYININFIFYAALLGIDKKFVGLKQEILILLNLLGIIIVDFFASYYSQKTDAQDATFNVILLIQIIINSNLLDLMKSKLVYFFSVWILLLIRFNDFKKWETYVTALILVNLVLLQNAEQQYLNRFESKVFRKKEKFLSLIRILSQFIQEPLCIIYQNSKGNQIKVLLQTGSFQNEYMKFENLQSQHSQLFAKLIEEHFPTVSAFNLPIKQIDLLFGCQTLHQQDLGIKSQDSSNQKSNERISNKFQRLKSGSNSDSKIVQINIGDQESVGGSVSPIHESKQNNQRINSESNQLINGQQPYVFQQKPTRMGLDTGNNPRFLDIIQESFQEHNLTEKPLDGLGDLKAVECLWNQKKCLFLFSQTDKLQLISLKQSIAKFEKQDTYKDQLLASVSHDFKTPLNGMILYIQMLEEMCQDETLQQYLNIVKKNAFLLLYMINDILDYTQIQNNQIRICPSNFNLKDLIYEVVELLSLQAQQKGIDLTPEIYLQNPEIFSDPNRLKQILLNFLSNSLKYTNEGKIQVTVEELQQRDRKSQFSLQRSVLKFTVLDTGVGIPDSIIPKLFNMYATFDHNNGSNKHGAGIGLVICKKLVGLLGPTDMIAVESQEGIGTKFSFLIYAQQPQELINQSQCGGAREQSYHSVLYEEILSASASKKSRNRTLSMVSQVVIFQKQSFDNNEHVQSKKTIQSIYRQNNCTDTEKDISEDPDQNKLTNIQY